MALDDRENEFVHVKSGKGRNGQGGRLAGSILGSGDDIVIGKGERDDLFLYRTGPFESTFKDACLIFRGRQDEEGERATDP